MFLTHLCVEHEGGKTWRLTRPLVWQGDRELIIIGEGFRTDFASVPKFLRWALDNAGANSEAAVLHDAVWRESQTEQPRVDPWDADGMFRRALRETGSTALTRGLMWFGVRAAAMAAGRHGRQGPPMRLKVARVLGMGAIGFVVLGRTLWRLTGGLLTFWAANWIATVLWWFGYEKRRFPKMPGPNLPYLPRKGGDERPVEEPPLLILDREGPAGREVAAKAIERTEAGDEVRQDDVEAWMAGAGSV